MISLENTLLLIRSCFSRTHSHLHRKLCAWQRFQVNAGLTALTFNIDIKRYRQLMLQNKNTYNIINTRIAVLSNWHLENMDVRMNPWSIHKCVCVNLCFQWNPPYRKEGKPRNKKYSHRFPYIICSKRGEKFIFFFDNMLIILSFCLTNKMTKKKNWFEESKYVHIFCGSFELSRPVPVQITINAKCMASQKGYAAAVCNNQKFSMKWLILWNNENDLSISLYLICWMPEASLPLPSTVFLSVSLSPFHWKSHFPMKFIWMRLNLKLRKNGILIHCLVHRNHLYQWNITSFSVSILENDFDVKQQRRNHFM